MTCPLQEGGQVPTEGMVVILLGVPNTGGVGEDSDAHYGNGFQFNEFAGG